MIAQEVEALGLYRKGEGEPSGGVSRASSLKTLSFPSSNRMPGAPQKRDSFVFAPSTITCCWPFSRALLKATGCSRCQERRKEGGRRGKPQAHGVPSPSLDPGLGRPTRTRFRSPGLDSLAEPRQEKHV